MIPKDYVYFIIEIFDSIVTWGKSWRAPLLIVVNVSSVVMVNDIRAGDARGSRKKLINEMSTNIAVGTYLHIITYIYTLLSIVYVWIRWKLTSRFITINARIQLQLPLPRNIGYDPYISVYVNIYIQNVLPNNFPILYLL